MSWMADMEYRANIVVRVISEFFWYGMQLSVFEVLYLHADQIAGWTVHDMRVFMGTLFVGDVLYMILIQENMDHLWSIVRKGDLDLYLVKPVNAQFMVSCRKISVSYVVNLFLVSGYLTWAVLRMPRPVGAAQVISFVVLIALGLVIGYSLRFMFMTIMVAKQDAGNIHFVWHQLHRLATRPDPIYPGFLRILVMFVFPVAFLASVPSRILVEGLNWRLQLGAVAVTVILLYLSHYFWEKALKHYSSASS